MAGKIIDMVLNLKFARMKRLNISLLVFLTVFCISCKDNRLEGMYEDKVGFLKSGEQMISTYIANKEIIFESPVFRSGIGTARTTVHVQLDAEILQQYNSANNTNYIMLPDDSFTIANKDFELTGDLKNVVVKINIDIKKLELLQGVMSQKYVVPLKLITSGEIGVNLPKSTMILIPEIVGGIRPNSATPLWSKTFDQMMINGTNHNTASFAVSNKYVFVNTRNENLKYYDRFTGAHIGEVVLPFKGSLSNFTVTSDDKDNLLISNLRNAATGLSLQTIYRIKGTSAPEKYIEFSHVYPNGRKMSINGNLDQEAVITSTVENSSRVLYWLVKNGVLISQEPQVFNADAAKIGWALQADAIAVGKDLEKGLFIAGNGLKSKFAFFDKTGESKAEYDLVGGGLDPASFKTHALAYATFNGANYLAVGLQQGLAAMHSILFDVTKETNLSLDPNSQKLIAYKGTAMLTLNNTNATVDVHLKVSDDAETMIFYTLGTNGSISAVQFDSKNITP